MTLLMNQVTLNHMAELPIAIRLLKPPAPSSTAMSAHLGFILSMKEADRNLPICKHSIPIQSASTNYVAVGDACGICDAKLQQHLVTAGMPSVTVGCRAKWTVLHIGLHRCVVQHARHASCNSQKLYSETLQVMQHQQLP